MILCASMQSSPEWTPPKPQRPASISLQQCHREAHDRGREFVPEVRRSSDLTATLTEPWDTPF